MDKERNSEPVSEVGTAESGRGGVLSRTLGRIIDSVRDPLGLKKIAGNLQRMNERLSAVDRGLSGIESQTQGRLRLVPVDPMSTNPCGAPDYLYERTV